MEGMKMRNDPKAGFKQLAYLAGVVLAVAASPSAAQVRTISGPGAGNPPCEVAAPDQAAAFPCGVILFSPDGSDSTQVLSAIARGAGAQVRFEYRAVAGVAATVPNRSVLRALASSSARLIPDRRVTAIAKPGGGGSGSSPQVTPKGVERIGGPHSSARGSGVGVAIVDTGLDFDHPDLAGAIATRCHDSFGGNCRDGDGHGTHVGGIVGARDNDKDVVGVAPESTLYAVRVLDNTGSGSDATVQAGLDWIWVENGGENAGASLKIAVANMSLGRDGDKDDNPALRTTVQRLNSQGVTIVVAAGNSASKEISQQVPAAYPEVMAIASTTATTGSNACKRLNNPIAADTASYFTTDGAGVAVSAPGEDKENVSRGCLISSVGILSLKAGGGTTRLSGTSMAAPHVAGVAALLVGGTADPCVVRKRIQTSAVLQGAAPYHSPTSGYTFDGVTEGIVSIPGALGSGATCP